MHPWQSLVSPRMMMRGVPAITYGLTMGFFHGRDARIIICEGAPRMPTV